jgi:Uma2 family endonuclease
VRALFAPDEVRLAVEVVSPESARRDRTVKLREYAEAGIPHYWCIEDCEIQVSTESARFEQGGVERFIAYAASGQPHALGPRDW